jgi:16S rRNA A1518/A1519 N6-dimethyltransferase RsmA/KsgA/DIM1 with predicted DNA glycosylase/AP lyase activity
MRKILFDAPIPNEAYLVMQREAAEKFSGSPYETQFSILAKPWFNFQIVWELRRTDFAPAPNVDCVLLAIRKRGSPLICREDMVLYRKFVRFGFQRWRRNLKLTFKPVFTYKQWKRLSKRLHFPVDAIPTDLSFEHWLGLFGCFMEQVPEGKRAIVLLF